jgi:hypothetical protein
MESYAKCRFARERIATIKLVFKYMDSLAM